VYRTLKAGLGRTPDVSGDSQSYLILPGVLGQRLPVWQTLLIGVGAIALVIWASGAVIALLLCQGPGRKSKSSASVPQTAQGRLAPMRTCALALSMVP
jgi:hypothetical protein